MQGGVEILCPFQLVGVALQGLGHRGVEHDVGTGDGIGRAQHPELKFVAGKGKRRGAVAVRGIQDEAGEHVDAQLHSLLFRAHIGGIALNGVQHGGQLIAQEDRDDGGRRLVASQPVVVSGRGNGGSQKSLIVVHRLDDRHKKQQELGVFVRRLAGREQVDAGIGGERPVVMLAAAVDPGKGLFMQQTHHAVLGRYALHHLHGQLILIGREVDGGIDGGKLMLGRGHLIVFRLCKDAQLPQLCVQFLHKGGHPGLDGAEVVIVQLLSLGRSCAEEGPAGVAQVHALFIQCPVDQKVFLLRADRGRHAPDRIVAEQLQHPESLPVQRFHAAKKRRFLIQRLPAVGAKGRGDTKGLSLDEGVAGGVPCSVAARLKGGPQAAGGEG